MGGQNRRIILDKSFLHAESRNGRRLHALKEAGCNFIITDTLVYECCTGNRDSLWVELQRKLSGIANSVQVCFHTAELFKQEMESKEPIESPFSKDLTNRLQVLLAEKSEFVPAELKKIADEAFQQREVESYEAFVDFCKEMAKLVSPYGENLRKSIAKRQDVTEQCRALVNDPRALNALISMAHGNPDKTDTYLPSAQAGLDDKWFAYHQTRSNLALLCVFMSKYASDATPSKEFRNTRFDAEYLTLLHYADGLATNETSGSLADMRRWLYGNTKKAFSTAQLDDVMPKENEIGRAAFSEWERSGRTHGHDVADWLSSERRLWSSIWDSLHDS